MPKRGFLRLAAPALPALAAAVVAGCYTGDAGLSPQHDQFYFPTGLSVSPGNTTLYVINSDFDLQFNGGTVQAVDLVGLRGRLSKILEPLRASAGVDAACASAGLAVNQRTELIPGPCAEIPSEEVVKSFATVGAFASEAAIVLRPDAPGARLFVPVRGDPSVTYFDIDDDRNGGAATFKLDCGGTGEDLRCAPIHKVGTNPYDNLRRLTLPVEPLGIAADDRGESIVVAHQTEASASLITNSWRDGERPTLQYFLTGLPFGPTEVVALPKPALLDAVKSAVPYQPGFVMTFRAAPEVDVLRYVSDDAASPPRPFLSRAGAFAVSANATGIDSRGIAIDRRPRVACEAACAKTDTACLRTCASVPMPVYVASRSPSSLLVGEIDTTITDNEKGPTGEYAVVRLFDAVPLSVGVSHVAVADVIGKDGALHPHVFAVSFDSRYIVSYDPAARRVDAVIRTGRGPHPITFDVGGTGADQHALMFVGHFIDSYLGVVDLDMRHPETFGMMFAAVGKQVAPREAK
jgi:hypothetical protein